MVDKRRVILSIAEFKAIFSRTSKCNWVTYIYIVLNCHSHQKKTSIQDLGKCFCLAVILCNAFDIHMSVLLVLVSDLWSYEYANHCR